MSKKVIGILGGMGPLATADLFQKITLHTAASCDQDHPRVCIDSNTDIADRTAALLHGGEDPVPEMIKSAKRLESIGADFLIMPCNTAHNYYEQVCEAVTIPVLHMIALTRDALKARGVKCAGLLATDGTLSAGHARVLAGIADSELQGALFAKTLQFGWSVRQLEAAAKNAQTEKKEKPEREPLPIEYEELTERLRSATGLKVKLEGTQEKGKITLQYTSEEELQRLWEWMER